MNYPYTINDLSSKCEVSKQSIYNHIRNNQDFINKNSIRKQRKIYYNQEVMDFFLAYYDKAPTEKPDIEKSNGEEVKPKETSDIEKPIGEEVPNKGENSVSESPSVDDRIKALESDIDAKDAEIKHLNDLLAAKEEERKELLNQNGALILTIQQLQQEKLLLLPAPKKPLGERIKSIFHKD